MNNQLEKLEKEILSKIKSDANQSFSDPLDRLESNSEKSLKYTEILYRVRKVSNKKTMEVRKKYGELYKDLKYKSKFLLKNKADIDAHINTDDSYFNLKMELKTIENLVDILEKVTTIYMNREYTERMIAKYKLGE